MPIVLGLTAGGVTGCGDDGAPEGDAATFCERLGRLADNDPFDAFGDLAGAAEIEAAFAALRARASELRDAAPEDARPVATSYADVVDELDTLLAGGAYLPSQVDVRRYRDAQLRYQDLAARLERYLTSECPARDT